MKSSLLCVLAGLAMVASSAKAENVMEFNGADMVAATDAALTAFSKENPDHASHLTGFKTWKTGADVKVKIYVLHGNAPMEINYVCLKSANQVHCTRN